MSNIWKLKVYTALSALLFTIFSLSCIDYNYGPASSNTAFINLRLNLPLDTAKHNIRKRDIPRRKYSALRGMSRVFPTSSPRNKIRPETSTQGTLPRYPSRKSSFSKPLSVPSVKSESSRKQYIAFDPYKVQVYKTLAKNNTVVDQKVVIIPKQTSAQFAYVYNKEELKPTQPTFSYELGKHVSNTVTLVPTIEAESKINILHETEPTPDEENGDNIYPQMDYLFTTGSTHKFTLQEKSSEEEENDETEKKEKEKKEKEKKEKEKKEKEKKEKEKKEKEKDASSDSESASFSASSSSEETETTTGTARHFVHKSFMQASRKRKHFRRLTITTTTEPVSTSTETPSDSVSSNESFGSDESSEITTAQESEETETTPTGSAAFPSPVPLSSHKKAFSISINTLSTGHSATTIDPSQKLVQPQETRRILSRVDKANLLKLTRNVKKVAVVNLPTTTAPAEQKRKVTPTQGKVETTKRPAQHGKIIQKSLGYSVSATTINPSRKLVQPQETRRILSRGDKANLLKLSRNVKKVAVVNVTTSTAPAVQKRKVTPTRRKVETTKRPTRLGKIIQKSLVHSVSGSSEAMSSSEEDQAQNIFREKENLLTPVDILTDVNISRHAPSPRTMKLSIHPNYLRKVKAESFVNDHLQDEDVEEDDVKKTRNLKTQKKLENGLRMSSNRAMQNMPDSLSNKKSQDNTVFSSLVLNESTSTVSTEKPAVPSVPYVKEQVSGKLEDKLHISTENVSRKTNVTASINDTINVNVNYFRSSEDGLQGETSFEKIFSLSNDKSQEKSPFERIEQLRQRYFQRKHVVGKKATPMMSYIRQPTKAANESIVKGFQRSSRFKGRGVSIKSKYSTTTDKLTSSQEETTTQSPTTQEEASESEEEWETSSYPAQNEKNQPANYDTSSTPRPKKELAWNSIQNTTQPLLATNKLTEFAKIYVNSGGEDKNISMTTQTYSKLSTIRESELPSDEARSTKMPLKKPIGPIRPQGMMRSMFHVRSHKKKFSTIIKKTRRTTTVHQSIEQESDETSTTHANDKVFDSEDDGLIPQSSDSESAELFPAPRIGLGMFTRKYTIETPRDRSHKHETSESAVDKLTTESITEVSTAEDETSTEPSDEENVSEPEVSTTQRNKVTPNMKQNEMASRLQSDPVDVFQQGTVNMWQRNDAENIHVDYVGEKEALGFSLESYPHIVRYNQSPFKFGTLNGSKLRVAEDFGVVPTTTEVAKASEESLNLENPDAPIQSSFDTMQTRKSVSYSLGQEGSNRVMKIGRSNSASRNNGSLFPTVTQSEQWPRSSMNEEATDKSSYKISISRESNEISIEDSRTQNRALEDKYVDMPGQMYPKSGDRNGQSYQDSLFNFANGRSTDQSETTTSSYSFGAKHANLHKDTDKHSVREKWAPLKFFSSSEESYRTTLQSRKPDDEAGSSPEGYTNFDGNATEAWESASLNSQNSISQPRTETPRVSSEEIETTEQEKMKQQYIFNPGDKFKPEISSWFKDGSHISEGSEDIFKAPLTVGEKASRNGFNKKSSLRSGVSLAFKDTRRFFTSDSKEATSIMPRKQVPHKRNKKVDEDSMSAEEPNDETATHAPIPTTKAIVVTKKLSFPGGNQGGLSAVSTKSTVTVNEDAIKRNNDVEKQDVGNRDITFYSSLESTLPSRNKYESANDSSSIPFIAQSIPSMKLPDNGSMKSAGSELKYATVTPSEHEFTKLVTVSPATKITDGGFSSVTYETSQPFNNIERLSRARDGNVKEIKYMQPENTQKSLKLNKSSRSRVSFFSEEGQTAIIRAAKLMRETENSSDEQMMRERQFENSHQTLFTPNSNTSNNRPPFYNASGYKQEQETMGTSIPKSNLKLAKKSTAVINHGPDRSQFNRDVWKESLDELERKKAQAVNVPSNVTRTTTSEITTVQEYKANWDEERVKVAPALERKYQATEVVESQMQMGSGKNDNESARPVYLNQEAMTVIPSQKAAPFNNNIATLDNVFLKRKDVAINEIKSAESFKHGFKNLENSEKPYADQQDSEDNAFQRTHSPKNYLSYTANAGDSSQLDQAASIKIENTLGPNAAKSDAETEKGLDTRIKSSEILHESTKIFEIPSTSRATIITQSVVTHQYLKTGIGKDNMDGPVQHVFSSEVPNKRPLSNIVSDRLVDQISREGPSGDKSRQILGHYTNPSTTSYTTHYDSLTFKTSSTTSKYQPVKTDVTHTIKSFRTEDSSEIQIDSSEDMFKRRVNLDSNGANNYTPVTSRFNALENLPNQPRLKNASNSDKHFKSQTFRQSYALRNSSSETSGPLPDFLITSSEEQPSSRDLDLKGLASNQYVPKIEKINRTLPSITQQSTNPSPFNNNRETKTRNTGEMRHSGTTSKSFVGQYISYTTMRPVKIQQATIDLRLNSDLATLSTVGKEHIRERPSSSLFDFESDENGPDMNPKVGHEAKSSLNKVFMQENYLENSLQPMSVLESNEGLLWHPREAVTFVTKNPNNVKYPKTKKTKPTSKKKKYQDKKKRPQMIQKSLFSEVATFHEKKYSDSDGDSSGSNESEDKISEGNTDITPSVPNFPMRYSPNNGIVDTSTPLSNFYYTSTVSPHVDASSQTSKAIADEDLLLIKSVENIRSNVLKLNGEKKGSTEDVSEKPDLEQNKINVETISRSSGSSSKDGRGKISHGDLSSREKTTSQSVETHTTMEYAPTIPHDVDIPVSKWLIRGTDASKLLVDNFPGFGNGPSSTIETESSYEVTNTKVVSGSPDWSSGDAGMINEDASEADQARGKEKTQVMSSTEEIDTENMPYHVVDAPTINIKSSDADGTESEIDVFVTTTKALYKSVPSLGLLNLDVAKDRNYLRKLGARILSKNNEAEYVDNDADLVHSQDSFVKTAFSQDNTEHASEPSTELPESIPSTSSLNDVAQADPVSVFVNHNRLSTEENELQDITNMSNIAGQPLESVLTATTTTIPHRDNSQLKFEYTVPVTSIRGNDKISEGDRPTTKRRPPIIQKSLFHDAYSAFFLSSEETSTLADSSTRLQNLLDENQNDPGKLAPSIFTDIVEAPSDKEPKEITGRDHGAVSLEKESIVENKKYPRKLAPKTQSKIVEDITLNEEQKITNAISGRDQVAFSLEQKSDEKTRKFTEKVSPKMLTEKVYRSPVTESEILPSIIRQDHVALSLEQKAFDEDKNQPGKMDEKTSFTLVLEPSVTEQEGFSDIIGRNHIVASTEKELVDKNKNYPETFSQKLSTEIVQAATILSGTGVDVSSGKKPFGVNTSYPTKSVPKTVSEIFQPLLSSEQEKSLGRDQVALPTNEHSLNDDKYRKSHSLEIFGTGFNTITSPLRNQVTTVDEIRIDETTPLLIVSEETKKPTRKYRVNTLRYSKPQLQSYPFQQIAQTRAVTEESSRVSNRGSFESVLQPRTRRVNFRKRRIFAVTKANIQLNEHVLSDSKLSTSTRTPTDFETTEPFKDTRIDSSKISANLGALVKKRRRKKQRRLSYRTMPSLVEQPNNFTYQLDFNSIPSSKFSSRQRVESQSATVTDTALRSFPSNDQLSQPNLNSDTSAIKSVPRVTLSQTMQPFKAFAINNIKGLPVQSVYTRRRNKKKVANKTPDKDAEPEAQKKNYQDELSISDEERPQVQRFSKFQPDKSSNKFFKRVPQVRNSMRSGYNVPLKSDSSSEEVEKTTSARSTKQRRKSTSKPKESILPDEETYLQQFIKPLQAPAKKFALDVGMGDMASPMFNAVDDIVRNPPTKKPKTDKPVNKLPKKQKQQRWGKRKRTKS